MSSKLLSQCLIAFFLIVSLTAAASHAESNEKTLRIGATLPLSGDYAFVGVELQRGMELALKGLPADSVKVWYEDEGVVDRVKAVGGFQKLVSANNVHAVLGSTVNTVTAYAPIATRHKIPVISLWDTNASIKKLGQFVFSIGFDTETAGEQMAEYAFKKLQNSKIAVISGHDEWSELISSAFVEKFKSLGGEIVAHESVNVTDSNLRSILTKIKSGPAQGIYAPLYLTALHAVIRQSREIGFKGPIMVADGMVEADAKQLSSAAEGVYATQVWLDAPVLLQQYQKTFGEASPVGLSFVGLGYDGIKLLVKARDNLIAEGKELNSQSLRESLATLDHTGITARINFAITRSVGQPETIVRVRNGNFEKISE